MYKFKLLLAASLLVLHGFVLSHDEEEEDCGDDFVHETCPDNTWIKFRRQSGQEICLKMFKFTDKATTSSFLWKNKWLNQTPDSKFIKGEYESAIIVKNGKIDDVISTAKFDGALCGVTLG
ncbi:unnamed protein product [Caenorhabditis bovis]|uniref:Uncharacterized protein n=1 Tax=Caenorhabditis bovis TaxID=2654633 RepID=A0A8S1F7H9_9PELO|nr:unnamed protein product [Caenorhabditis bovis]